MEGESQIQKEGIQDVETGSIWLHDSQIATFIQVEHTPLWILPVGVGPYTKAQVTCTLWGANLDNKNNAILVLGQLSYKVSFRYFEEDKITT